jgi:hypothetical protein
MARGGAGLTEAKLGAARGSEVPATATAPNGVDNDLTDDDYRGSTGGTSVAEGDEKQLTSVY